MAENCLIILQADLADWDCEALGHDLLMQMNGTCASWGHSSSEKSAQWFPFGNPFGKRF